ncbi:transport protein TonB [bacterium BMS3Abin07]|nr:transport protein TonB [bacterium BMS3Abin07]HDL20707.1 energy transducer TonB [Nitrospirota bacterium]
MIQNYGVIISVLIHVVILSIPLSTTVMSLSEQRSGDINVSIIESYNATPDIRTDRVVMPRVEKERVVKKEIIKPVRIKEKPKVKTLKTPQEKQTKIIAVKEEPGRKEVETGTEAVADVIKPAVAEEEEEMDESEVQDVTGSEEGNEIPIQSVSAGRAEAAEDLAETAKEDSLQGGVTSDRPHITEVGAADGPRFIKRVIPEYPWLARKLEKEGRVLLKLTIDETGKLIDVELVEKAGFGFDRVALQAVRRSTFLPARKNGVPVRSEALLSVKFVLKSD